MGELPIYPESILEHPRVGVDLQLVDSQRDEFRELTKLANEKFQGRNKELSIKYSKGLFDSPQAYMKELSKLEETKRKDIKEIVETVLLPFQRDRLQQLTVQARLQASGSVALSSAEFANTFNLTDNQKKRLAEKQQEMERGLRTEIRELRKKRQQEVVESVLTTK